MRVVWAADRGARGSGAAAAVLPAVVPPTRDYEARRRSTELGLSEGELVITREELESVRDRLYVLECAVKDVEADLAERGDDPEDRQRAYDWLLDAAKQAVVPSPS